MLCRRAGHPGGWKTDPSAMDPLPEGSVSTPRDAKQGEAAAYQHRQPLVSWHLLKGNTEIGADAFTSQVKQDGPRTKIIFFRDCNTDNTLHLQNLQFFSTFLPSEFAFPTIRFFPNSFQALLGQQVRLCHSRSCTVLTPPWQYLQTEERYRTAGAPAAQNALLLKLEATPDLSKTQEQPLRQADVQDVG